MAQVVKLKRTAVAGKVPSTSNLELGELAINTYDGKIFFQRDNGTPSIQQVLTTNSVTTGSLNIYGDITGSNLYIQGNTTIDGNLILGGNITIGDSSTDTVSITADLSSSIIPDLNATFDLGSTTKKWNNLYVVTSSADYFIGDGSQLTNLTVDIAEVASINQSFSNSSNFSVSHNFNTRNIIVSVYDSNYAQIIPTSVTLTDDNNVTITLSSAQSGYVVVAKGGHIVSGSADDSNALNGQNGSYYLDFDNHTNNPFTQSVNAITASNHIVPSQNVTYDLGSPTHRFRDLYLSNNSIFFEMGTISMNTGSGFFELKDANDDPAIIKTETFVLSPSGSTTQTFISAGVQGGVKFLSISDTQMVTYSIDNYDLQQSVTFSYIDSSGNSQSVTVSANTSNYELDAQEGSVTRTSGTDKYRIKLLRVPNDTPTAQIEVSSLVVTGSDGGFNITINNSGSVEIKNQDDTPAEITAGNIIISGSQGQTTLTNDLSGGLAVVNESNELQPIRVNQVEIVDSTTGNVINLTSVSGSLTTTATNSSGTTIEPPKSNLSGSFTGSFNLTGDIVSTLDCVKVGTTLNPICEIHGTDIFGTINATNGVISGSSQIVNILDELNSYSSSLKTAVEITGSNVVVLGDLSVRGTTTTINSTTVQLDDNIIELNGSDSTNGGLYVKDATAPNTATGSLLWDSTTDYWKAGVKDSESKVLLAGGDSVVSGSSQITISDTIGYTTISSSLDSRIVSLNDYTTSQDSKNSTLSSYTSSIDSKFTTLGTYTGSIDTKWSTLENVTSSLINATSSYETKGNGIISGSSQVVSSLVNESLNLGTGAITASFFKGDGSQITNVVTEIAEVATVTSSFDNTSSISVTHNFNSKNVIISVYQSNDTQIIPQSVTLTDNNTANVVLSAAHSGYVVVAKGGHIVSGSTEWTSIANRPVGIVSGSSQITDLTTYKESVTGNSTYLITHSLNEEYPIVQAWNTQSKRQEIPQIVESTSVNVISVTFSNSFSGLIIVKK